MKNIWNWTFRDIKNLAFNGVGLEKEGDKRLKSGNRISHSPSSSHESFNHAEYVEMFNVSYTGEKNPGEMGIIKKYRPHYAALRNRSWQAFMESDAVKGILTKFSMWVIGNGLNIQSKPVMGVLEASGIAIDKPSFTKKVEDRFKLWCDSEMGVHDHTMTFHALAKEVDKNATVAGDVLIITRFEKGQLTVEAVDADRVMTPFLGASAAKAKRRGNRISHGIEIDKNNRHVAYYVIVGSNKFRRIRAKDFNGDVRVFLIIGERFRLGNIRGVPLVSAGLQAIKNLDRYKEALIGGAEERAKIAYTIEHDKDSTGTNPLTAKIVSSNSSNKDIEGGSGDVYSDGQLAADKFANTTGKQAINLPIGSALKALVSDMEMSFDKFFFPNLQIFCAAVGIPIEVALSKFDSNFSASRAALKDWEHTLAVRRKHLSIQFYQRIFAMWLVEEDIQGRLSAPGLLQAKRTDQLLFEAYTKARWVGASIPHIDPVKEAKAERIKLGGKGSNLPLTTGANATEALSEGDYETNLEVITTEIEALKKALPEMEIEEEKSEPVTD